MPASPAPVTIDRQDARFDTLKKGHNLRFPATDAEAASRIVICSNAEEVAAALQRIVSSGLRPTVRSGGHCYEDFVANNPNGAILDLSMHNAVGVDAHGTYHIAPGAMLGDVYQTLYKKFGVTIPAGTCYTVGAGGHISGGGYGLLSRLHGLTIDWVSGVDILTVDSSGKVVARSVDKQHEPELLRACRGAGGGNFGIITGFRCDKLPPAPREVAQAGMSIPWSSMTVEKFTKFLMIYGDYWVGRGTERDTWGLSGVLVLDANDSPNSRIGLEVQFCNADGTANDLSPLHEFFALFKEFAAGADAHDGGHDDAPASGTYYRVTKLPWLDATLADGVDDGGSRAKYKSAYMKQSFTAVECAVLHKYFNSPDARGSVLAIDGYGGAINQPDRVHDTAMAQRSSVMKLQLQSYWRNKDQDAARLKFMDEFYTATYTGGHVPPEYQGTPFGPRYEGCYMNYADSDMLRYSFWPQLFYGAGDLYPFLQGVKKRYDPNNIFHSSMSVRT